MDHRWNGFLGGAWTERIDVRDFIQRNYTPYEGGAGFLAGATARTKALNEKYEDVQDAFTDISGKFSNASNAAKYYYYTGDADILDVEEHKSEYNTEDFEVFDAFVQNGSAHNFTFDLKDDAGKAYNVQSYFYNRLGKLSEADEETIADALTADLLLTAEEEE